MHINPTKPNNPKQPVIRGRASIAEVEITIKVLWKNQLNKLIEYLVSEGYSFEWNVVARDSIRLDEFYLNIRNVHWAHNATAICKILEECDYQDDCTE
jgi:hypothetical protein